MFHRWRYNGRCRAEPASVAVSGRRPYYRAGFPKTLQAPARESALAARSNLLNRTSAETENAAPLVPTSNRRRAC